MNTTKQFAAVVGALVAFAMVFFMATPSASAFYGWNWGGTFVSSTSDTTQVVNNNNASVSNSVSASSDTGDNTANGGDGDEGGDAGDSGDAGNARGYHGTATGGNSGDTGNGGAGGDGGEGGVIETGNATTTVIIGNEVNTTYTDIEGCGCEDNDVVVPNRRTTQRVRISDTETTSVANNNNAAVSNSVEASSDTGDNTANGGDGDEGGDAGDSGDGGDATSNYRYGRWYRAHRTNTTGGNSGETGNGGAGGDGALGGLILTGDAETNVGIVSVVNTTMTRVSR